MKDLSLLSSFIFALKTCNTVLKEAIVNIYADAFKEKLIKKYIRITNIRYKVRI